MIARKNNGPPKPKTEKLYTVRSSWFDAGFVVSIETGKVIIAAPVMYKILIGLGEAEAIRTCRRKRWDVRRIS